MYSQIIPLLKDLFTWEHMMFLVLGTLIGFLFGILPGLGGPQVLALLMPITFTMEPTSAIMLMIGAMGAIPTSGSISSILINTPGTPQSAATCIDGFEMTKRGQAGQALGSSAFGSLLGALIGVICLLLLLPLGFKVVLAFSYPEFFMMGIMGLSVISVVGQGMMWKSLIISLFGLALTTVGFDPFTGNLRYTFGIDFLYDGFKLVPVLIGLFAIPEAVSILSSNKKIAQLEQTESIMKGVYEGIGAIFKHFGLFFRSSIIGTVIGIIPGIGGAVANYVAYGHAVQSAKDRSQFGKGDIRGVIAPESANNAKDGGAFVPTLIFGIPGSIEMAVLMGALILHGIQVGPRMMLEHSDVAMTLIFALVGANVLASALAIFAAGPMARIATIPAGVIAPVILVFSILGAYAYQGSIGDVYVTIIFGVFGLILRRFGFPIVPLIIALVLGSMIQINFHQTLLVFGLTGFVTKPISLFLLVGNLLIIFLPIIQKWRRKGSEVR